MIFEDPKPTPKPQPGPVSQPRDASKWGLLATELFGAEFLEISFLLRLLRPPVLEGWTHVYKPQGGWYNPETKAFMSYKGARIVIANRISELGLSPELVYAAPHNVPQGDWREQHEEWKRFNRLSFEKQMDEFR